jgi:hypothetical protein
MVRSSFGLAKKGYAMVTRTLGAAAVVLLLTAVPARAADKYTAKVADGAAPPKELAEPIRKELAERSVQVTDDKGEVFAELWFRKELPAKATEAQVKNGLGYRQVPETTFIGAVSFPKGASDYRKQKLPPGVYTLRLVIQPMNGDHMGTAPYSDFLAASPAADDKSAGTLEPKALYELSAKSTGGHVAVFLLFPGRDASDTPKMAAKADGHHVLFLKLEAAAAGAKAPLGIGLTLVGSSNAA